MFLNFIIQYFKANHLGVFMKKSKYFSLAISIAIPFLLGALTGFITKKSMDSYSSLIHPPLSLPSILFPIIWTILYIAMGISSWIIYQSNHPHSQQALKIYGIQLVINILWPILFFTFHLSFISFLWIVLLIFLVILMIIMFYQISHLAAYLQIPYLLWLIFAGYLNLCIFILNK